MLRGVNISQYQAYIGIRALAAQTEFVFCRASYGSTEDIIFNGTGTHDGMRRFMFHEVRDYGMVPGAYHFLMHSDSDQALTFVRAVKSANDAHVDGALCAVVVEHDIKRKSIPNADDVRRFIERFQELCPMQPLFICTNAPFWAAHIKVDLQRYDNVYVWLERWTDASGEIDTLDPMMPYEWWDAKIGGRTPTIIQFTSQAYVSGTRVFGNLYRGDRKSLERLAQVALPFTLRKSQGSLPVKVPLFQPQTARSNDVPKDAGRTTLVQVGALLGVASIVGAIGIMVWASGRGVAEPIFDRTL